MANFKANFNFTNGNLIQILAGEQLSCEKEKFGPGSPFTFIQNIEIKPNVFDLFFFSIFLVVP